MPSFTNSGSLGIITFRFFEVIKYERGALYMDEEQKNTLIVDNDFHIRQSIKFFLERDGYAVDTAGSGQEAVEKIKALPFNVIISSYNLPDLKGADFLNALQNNGSSGELIFISDTPDVKEAVSLIRKGVFDYLSKPFEIDKMSFLVQKAVEKQKLIKEIVNLKSGFWGPFKSLIDAIDARDHFLSGHSEKVRDYALKIVYEMGLPKKDVKDIEFAALAHDIGMIGVPVLMVGKGLSEKDREHINMHPVIGAKILALNPIFSATIPSVLHHHEAYDGTGYPKALKGDDIPLGARIINIAEIFDAITTNRSYRDAMSRDSARMEIIKESGKKFHPDIVELFKKIF